jgi:hypothetical protein
LKTFSGLNDVEPREWHTTPSVKDWWIERIPKHWQPRKDMALLEMLIFFEIWQERNASVF